MHVSVGWVQQVWCARIITLQYCARRPGRVLACEHWLFGEFVQTQAPRASAADPFLVRVAIPGLLAMNALRKAACSSLVRPSNLRNVPAQKDQQQQPHLWTGMVTGTNRALPVPQKSKMSLGTKAFLLQYSNLRRRTSH